ncbi:hypothetical protein HN873_033513, partial [Arachis hypogaea]
MQEHFEESQPGNKKKKKKREDGREEGVEQVLPNGFQFEKISKARRLKNQKINVILMLPMSL